MVQHNYFQICFYSEKISGYANWKSDRFNYVCSKINELEMILIGNHSYRNQMSLINFFLLNIPEILDD